MSPRWSHSSYFQVSGNDPIRSDEPGFTRVVTIKEIRAKEGNLSIPLYVGGETQAQTDAATELATTALTDALASWLESSRKVRDSLQTLLTAPAK